MGDRLGTAGVVGLSIFFLLLFVVGYRIFIITILTCYFCFHFHYKVCSAQQLSLAIGHYRHSYLLLLFSFPLQSLFSSAIVIGYRTLSPFLLATFVFISITSLFSSGIVIGYRIFIIAILTCYFCPLQVCSAQLLSVLFRFTLSYRMKSAPRAHIHQACGRILRKKSFLKLIAFQNK